PGARPTTPLSTGSAPAVQNDFVTDADGRFRITAVPSGRFTVRAHHRDFADGSGGPVDVTAAAPAEVSVVLHRGAELAGQAGGDDGTPIFGAEVVVRDGDRTVAVGFSDQAGRYSLLHVFGAVTVSAGARGFATVDHDVNVEPALEGARMDQDFVLP